MKKILKSFLMMMICVWGLVFTCDIVYAEEKEAILFTLDTAQDVAVTITYEIEDISFQLISPSGQIVTKDTDTDNITVFSGQTSTLIFLGQAEPGEWKIKYDKGSNESINVSADIQDSSFFITEYNVGDISGDRIPVDFLVSGKEDTYYDYKLLLTTDVQSLNGKELARGSGKTGDTISLEAPLDNVNTYDAYYLLLYVSYDLNGAEIFDYKYSGAFGYTNSATPEAMENVDITVEHDRKIISLNWDGYVTYGATGVYVAAYRGEECISSAEYLMSEGHTAEIPYEDGDTIRFEISYKNNRNIVSEVLQKEVNTKLDMLTLPESGKVSSDIWSFEYKGAENTEVVFRINDVEHVITLDGDGSKYITLPENRNNIYITYRDAEGYNHTYQRTANISKIVPTIELLRPIDGVTTRESFIMISGTTNAQSLTINNEAVEIVDDVFVYQYSLIDGENDIVIEAAIDDSITRLNATVTKEVIVIAKETTWIPLLLGLAVSLAGIVLVSLLTWRRSRKLAGKIAKKKLTLKSFLVINWILAILTLAGWIAIIIYEGTPAYLELAYESLEKADKLLWLDRILMWIAVGLSAIAVLRTILCIIIDKYHKNKKSNKEGMDEKTE